MKEPAPGFASRVRQNSAGLKPRCRAWENQPNPVGQTVQTSWGARTMMASSLMYPPPPVMMRPLGSIGKRYPSMSFFIDTLLSHGKLIVLLPLYTKLSKKASFLQKIFCQTSQYVIINKL